MGFVLKCARPQLPQVMSAPVIMGYIVKWRARGRQQQRNIRGGLSAAQRFVSRLPYGSGANIVPRFKK